MAISISGNIVYGAAFVISYNSWSGTPDGDVELEDSEGNILALTGSVSGTTSGTVTCTMPSLPASGDIDCVRIESGVQVRLS